MASINRTIPRPVVTTHAGAPARRIDTLAELRRSLMACLLWEDSFYESGESIADRLKGLVGQAVKSGHAAEVVALMHDARHEQHLRHAPLLIARELARVGALRPAELANVIMRADELTEFAALYWQDGRCPLSAAVKKGLALAFGHFDEYQLAKYDREGAVRLRDVLFLTHPKPKDDVQAALWKRLANRELRTPDTWEVALSGGADKLTTWTRLLQERKLGALALLRNLRNMQQVNVDESLIKSALTQADVTQVLPFRFIAAARYAPFLEPELEAAMFRAAAETRLDKPITVLVDMSGSMGAALSEKSDMRRIDAACGVAMIAREISRDVKVYAFSDEIVQIPSRRGFALRDAIVASMPMGSTQLGKAVQYLNECDGGRLLIVISDEQSHDSVPNPRAGGYMINVGTYQHGVGYGPWVHIDGWSDAVIKYIVRYEHATA